MTKIVQVARYTADGTQVERAFEKMGAAGEKMSQRVKQGAAAMSPSLRAIDASAGVAKDKIESLAGASGSLGTVLRSIGPAGLAAAAGIGAATIAFTALQGATRNAVRDLGAIDIAAQRVGVSTDRLQELRFAVLGIGGAAEQADAALSQFAEKLGEATLTRSGGAFNALGAIGFSPEEIASMRSVEEALPRITDRIGEMSDATQQMRVARELGLEPLLPLLQEGEGAFNRAARAAHEMGYVIDHDVLTRAREMSGQWEQASRIIDLQLKSSLVDLAPLFLSLAENIAGATRELVIFLDRFDVLDRRARSSVERQLQESGRGANALIDQFGLAVTQGGNAAAGRTRAQFGGAVGLDVAASHLNLNLARDRYAYLIEEAEQLRRRLADINRQAETFGGATGSSLTAATAPAVDQLRLASEQFVAQLESELRVRKDLLGVTERFPKLIGEEAQAQYELSQQIRQLEEARRRGVIASDEELARLQEAITKRAAEAAAAREQAAALAAYQQQASSRQSFLQSLESPEERLAREARELRKQEGVERTPEEVRRGLAAIERQYRDLAAAQYEASLQGRLLSGVIQGQIRDFDDLMRTLLAMGTDAVVRELMAGGFRGPGGVGGFASRVWERFSGGPGVSGLLGGNAELDELGESAQKVARDFADALSPSAAEAGAKLLAGAAASASEATSKAQATLATGALTKSAIAAASALAKVAASGGGKGAAGFIGDLLSGGIGGGGKVPVKGLGKALGGPLMRDQRHAGAELGPELLMFGGWAQAAPNASVEGLAVLARLARQAEAAPAARGAPQINLTLINSGGQALAVESSETTIGADGSIDVRAVLRQQQAQDIVEGRQDKALRARFPNLKQARIPR